MKAKLSIIVPVYNAEDYLEQCLQSISFQSYKKWECLLVDDGSTDNSGLICDRMAELDNRFCVLHKENGGVSSARNLGIKEAKGEWIIFVDADDFIGEAYLQGLIGPLLEGNQLDFVHGGCTNYENGRISSVNQEYEYYIGEDKGRLFRSFRGLVVSKLFRTSILREKELLFDEGMKIAEDMAFTMDYLFFVNSYAFVSEKSYYYRRDNENSATHKKKWHGYDQYRQSFIHLYQATVDYTKKFGIKENDYKLRYEQRANHYYEMLRSLYHDSHITRKKRMQIMKDNAETEYIDLMNYVSPESETYKALRLLKDKKFVLFDIRQLIREFITYLKVFIKTMIKR